MAFEHLDLENKWYIPTQQLLDQLQIDLATLHDAAIQSLIRIHDNIAALSAELYDAPLSTLTRWYDQAVGVSVNLYASFLEVAIPQIEANYREILTTTTDWSNKTREHIAFMVDNPEQVTTEAIQTITENLTAIGNVSAELTEYLQEKTAAIVALLLEHPWQTLESASMELLSNLLKGYFELVSSLLASM